MVTRAMGVEGMPTGGPPDGVGPVVPAWIRWVSWRVAVPLGVLILAVNWLVSAPRTLFMDFTKSYYPGASALLEGPAVLWELMAVEALGPPFVMLPMTPLSVFGDAQFAAWVFFGLGVVASVASLVMLGRTSRMAIWPVLTLLFLANGPLLYSLREGNTSHFVLLLLVAGVLAWRRDRPFVAGLMFGACATMKMPLLVLPLYLLATGRWRVAAGAGAMIAGWVAITTVAYGPALVGGWFEHTLLPYSSGAVGAYNSQTLDGFLLRLETGATHLRNYMPVVRSDFHSVARLLLSGGLIAAVAYGLWRRRRGRDFDELELCCVLVAALIVAPLAWSHYYAILLLPWGLHFGGRLRLPADRITGFLIAGSIVLASFPVLRTTLALEHGPVTSRTVVSFCLVGAVCLFVALVRGLVLSSRPAERAAAAGP